MELIDLVKSVVIFLLQTALLIWLTFLLGSQTVILTVLLFWIYSDHIVVSVSIDFPSNLQRKALFYRIAYDYSCTDWISFLDHLKNVPWEDIFKISASAPSSEFFEWVQIGIDVCMLHCKYQVKPHLSP